MTVFENVQQEIKKLIPSSLISDITCFVFHDKHPRDEKNIDITVCTKNGDLREYFQRDLQSSLDLNCAIKKPSDLRILRNTKSELFYLLATKEELFIISSKESLQVYKRFTNIDKYEINDTACSGETFLKVVRKDDAVPLLFDNNFECLEDCGVMPSLVNTEDSLPILNELKRKLVEARYISKCNEKTYAHYLNLHQKVSLFSDQNQQPTTNSSIFQDNINNISGALKLKTQKPCFKVCNKKIVIMFNVLIQSKEPLENIHILLQNTTIPSLVYLTKIFTKVPTSPYWQEPHTNKLEPGQEYVITAVVDLEELKQNLTSRIELNGSLAYEVSKQEYLVPFEDVIVSSMDMIGDEFDVLSSIDTTTYSTVIAVLAATEKTELCFRHIKEDNEPDVSVLDLFCTHLQMDRVEIASNAIVYRKSPYHALNGTMIIFHEKKSENAVPVSVHTRSPSQVITLLHCIYDVVPAKIIATAPTYKITAKTDGPSHYNEDISNTPEQLNYKVYATSMLNRSTKILEHLDGSMIKMNESKKPSVQNKVGTHIDLFAGGIETFIKFKESMMKEAKYGIDSLKFERVNTENNAMLEEVEQGVDSLIKSDSMDGSTGSDVMYID